ncbi:MAG: hypothetical protein NTW37_03675, partial [Proteobacteria bacterium]|nr:hypothetical protein [Pseudomonadota bacterium]
MNTGTACNRTGRPWPWSSAAASEGVAKSNMIRPIETKMMMLKGTSSITARSFSRPVRSTYTS